MLLNVDHETLIEGVEKAKDMQQKVIELGCSMIEKKEIKRANDFRYCVLENLSANYQDLFGS